MKEIASQREGEIENEGKADMLFPFSAYIIMPIPYRSSLIIPAI